MPLPYLYTLTPSDEGCLVKSSTLVLFTAEVIPNWTTLRQTRLYKIFVITKHLARLPGGEK